MFGATEEHQQCLEAVLKRIEEAGATLNKDKCEFCKDSIKFLGHIIDQNGIQSDPDKTSAVIQMPIPQSLTDLRRFMGLVNQLGNFRHI